MKTGKLQQSFQETIDYEEIMNCTRCGFCLPACPTYLQTGGNEASSPRGRIALMKAVADGRKAPDEEVEAQLNECLGCRACEPACPSGVNYGHLLEQARSVVQKHKKHSPGVKIVRKAVFDWMFMSHKRMQKMHTLRYWYEKTPAQQVMRKTKMLQLLPGEAALMERVLPKAAAPTAIKREKEFEPSPKKSVKRVAFFRGCLMSTMFSETNDSTRYLLKQAGCDIITPEKQECCGALHAHGGETEQAKLLAKKNIAAFEELEVDAIVSNAGGCGAGLKNYPFLLREEAGWVERAKAFSEKTVDICTLLASLDLPDMKSEDTLVTYQPSCHLENVMKEKGYVEELLRKVNGVKYVAMPEKEHCCGSAGIYNLVQPKMAMQILDKKMTDVKLTKASKLVTSNPGCLLQMKAGIEREGMHSEIEALHIVDFLAEAVRKGQDAPDTN
ncbi:(Fe-S)-binding protein [Alkalicoccus daliensis]|uniref:Glycolate oxidase iron-sulfur subunit n=1 Tax=Alkalicoccus daliensis TaxID=745820 RepID=A0A1H0DP23_9BACI|nr:(Fe-S)-binding protein [Alkalicoccus daliensis]SDN71997.1 glycolate oxidase iron-sulfur subunit [Alkalicoccus daliensis]